MTSPITPELVNNFRHITDSRSGQFQLARNALCQVGAKRIGLDHPTVAKAHHVFSYQLKGKPSVTNQKSSGRCWIFAGLNIMRRPFIEKHRLKDFEFSQTYLYFWDKLEKANYFLDNIVLTSDRPLDDRDVRYLLKNPISDGGQWDTFANLVRKYGVIPQCLMRETYNSRNSRTMNALLASKLREWAAVLRQKVTEGTTAAAIDHLKLDFLSEVYRILCIHLGEPPFQFDWEYRDKDKKFHRHTALSPLTFLHEFVPYQADTKVTLAHCPSPDHPLKTVLQGCFSNNMRDQLPIRFINLPIEELKKATIASLKDGEGVYVGCDVRKSSNTDEGVMHPDLYDTTLLYGWRSSMTKEECLTYFECASTHGMAIVGVDLNEQGQPRKWKIENSWGKASGKDGYLLMDDGWFDQFVFKCVVDVKHLSEEYRPLLNQEAVEVPPWHPLCENP